MSGPYTAFQTPAQLQVNAQANPYAEFQSAPQQSNTSSGNFMDDFVGKNSNDLLPADAPGAAFFNRLSRTAKGIVSTVATPPESAGDYASLLAGPGGPVLKRLFTGQVEAEKQLGPQFIDQAKGAVYSHQPQAGDSFAQRAWKAGPSLEDARAGTTLLSMLNPFASASVANVNTLSDQGQLGRAAQEGTADAIMLAASIKSGKFAPVEKSNVLQMKPIAPSVWDGPPPPGYPEAPLSSAPIQEALTKTSPVSGVKLGPGAEGLMGITRSITKDGKPLGQIKYEVKGDTVTVHHFGGPEQDYNAFSNALGRQGLRQVADQLLEAHPEIKQIEGIRVGGARGEEGRSVTIPIRKSAPQPLSSTPIQDALEKTEPRHVGPSPAQWKRMNAPRVDIQKWLSGQAEDR